MNLQKNTVFKGWPPYRKLYPQELWEFWNFRCDLTLEDGLILKRSRIVIPASMSNQVLQAIHLGHQGENKIILRAREPVFWPGISADIRQMVKNCDFCNKHQPKLPIMQPDLPTRPWEKLGTDIFEFNGNKYLMIVDYYSRLPVIRLLSDMTSHTVCNHFTSVLAEYGLPTTIIACKTLLRKALEEDECPYTALWIYRTTPLDDQVPSPHELMFGRKPQTTLPCSRSTLKSKHPSDDLHQEANQRRQENQAAFYNRKTGSDKRSLKSPRTSIRLERLKEDLTASSRA
ncbi:uncharacterized protein K02A2.6-like [Acropora millepora]|uniref:uncharacterized protein K02A2.6-like n=1 Tax=Acropora millepora TaxID=45264 RepID=UPI001CF326BF|nr:uncharacterized protein K02A2.6-like [Acropora millepora]